MPLRIDYRPMKLPRDAHRATAPASGRVDNPKAARTRVSTQSPADAQFVPRLMHLPPVRVPGVTLVAAPARAAACPASPMFSRPRDFAARIVRGETTSLLRVLHRPAIWRQRIAGIVTVGLLASVLAPLGWGTPGGIEPAAAQAGSAGLQPFERGGDSFPGSAFYFIAPEDSGLLAPRDAEAAWQAQQAAIHRDDAPAPGSIAPNGAVLPEPSITGGAAARPLVARGSGEDKARALQCLTAAIYYEAASEPDGGQRAVAQVVLNRVSHPAFPKSVCGVVYQGSERPSCQFSFACDGTMARRPVPAFWERARRVAQDALSGYVYAPGGLATHYHTSAVHPYWADSLTFLGTIGAHRFYRWAGSAGRPAAFSATYLGVEPPAAPHPRTWTPAPIDIADPLKLEKAFEAGRLSAIDQARQSEAALGAASFGQAPVPHTLAPRYTPTIVKNGGEALYRADQLPGVSTIRPEYRDAGRWIAQPSN